MNAEGCFPEPVDSPSQHDSLSGVFVSPEHIPLSAALALVEDRPASKARLGPCRSYILTHQARKNILPGEDVRGVSFETRGVGPREDGAIPVAEKSDSPDAEARWGGRRRGGRSTWARAVA